ncbi:hypothetical protein RJ639_029917 [Escallonia herrerae]|uniref:Retrovirus-related Pol polyprotein from transposon RE1 n=1 Tax=Escallonia herrerae TaxID=1293975 RepID=A0AA88X7S0_9ASTE|nr:hypothetical protein RJ639_029917 [Escallonia herrerae]
MVKMALTRAWRSLDSSETTSSTLGGTLRPTMAIDGRGKLGHLTRDVRQPAAGDPSLSAWRSENSLIIVWLINFMEPTIGLNRDFDEVQSRILGKKNLSPPFVKPFLKLGGRKLDGRETCWKIHGKPPNWKKKNGSDNRAFQVSNEGNQAQQSTQEASPFIKEKLEHLYTLSIATFSRNKKIKIADGSLPTIAGTGSIVLSPSITLRNVLHVPKLSCNLLSISKLTNDLKCQANFYSTRYPKSIGLSHDIDGNKNGGTTGTKELLVYSGRKQIQRNETHASQYCQNSVPQTIQKSIEVTGDTHTKPIHLNLPSSESSQSKSSMSDLDKLIAHCKVYVDDIILTGDDIAEIERLKQCLASEFEIKDLGSLKFFLGMKIARSRKGIAMSQRKYVLDLLKETSMSGCRPVETPIDPNQKLGDNKGDPVNTSRYQKLVGKLIYLSHTRPDIAFAVSLVSQFMHSLHEEHLEAVYRILRYLKSSQEKDFFRKNEQRNLEAYTDADWAGSITDRKSTSGYYTFLQLRKDRSKTA